jgi:hypothetical protein
MKSLLYLVDQPLDERNFDRFGIQVWIDRGWTVEAWDLTPWIFPRVWHDFLAFGRKPRKFTGYHVVASVNDLKRNCARVGSPAYVIDFTSLTSRSLRAHWQLKRRGAIRTVFSVGTVPAPEGSGQGSFVQRLRRVAGMGLTHFGRGVFQKALSRIAARLVPPGLAVVSGAESVRRIGNRPTMIKAHSFDYDTYLRARTVRATAIRKFAVFIDQDYCFHQDFISLRINRVVTPERYFPALCEALAVISAALALEVRVAAHPRASYRERGFDYFKGLPVEYGRTAELIRDCSVVVCHGSTAVQLAVLFEKPVIFLTTDQLRCTEQGREIAAMATQLGQRVINIDGDLRGVDWEKQLRFDKASYAAYRNAFIKMDGSPEIPLWNLVIDYVDRQIPRARTKLQGNYG